jgi:hypothetical protein
MPNIDAGKIGINTNHPEQVIKAQYINAAVDFKAKTDPLPWGAASLA